MALNDLVCAVVPLRSYSLTHTHTFTTNCTWPFLYSFSLYYAFPSNHQLALR